jgi:hypothetical protein
MNLLTNGFVSDCGLLFGLFEQFEAGIVRFGAEEDGTVDILAAAGVDNPRGILVRPWRDLWLVLLLPP